MANAKSVSENCAGEAVRCKVVERNQLFFRPVDVEKLVGPTHRVRAIWALTASTSSIREGGAQMVPRKMADPTASRISV